MPGQSGLGQTGGDFMLPTSLLSSSSKSDGEHGVGAEKHHPISVKKIRHSEEVVGRCKLDPGLKAPPRFQSLIVKSIYQCFQLEPCFLSLHPYDVEELGRPAGAGGCACDCSRYAEIFAEVYMAVQVSPRVCLKALVVSTS